MPIHTTCTHIHIYILSVLSYYIYLYIYVYVYPLRALWPPEACSTGEVCLRRYFPLWTHPKVIFSSICSDYSVNFLRLRLVAFLQIYDHRLHAPQNYLVHFPLTHFWRPWASKCLTLASRCLPFGSSFSCLPRSCFLALAFYTVFFMDLSWKMAPKMERPDM